MAKYRKKPVIIEAVKLQQRFDWPDWFHNAVSEKIVTTFGLGKFGEGEIYCLIKTLEGEHRGDEGDFIIQGIKGELYPCKSDIFELTYEKV